MTKSMVRAMSVNKRFQIVALPGLPCLFLVAMLGCSSRVALKSDRIPEETVVGRFSLEMTLELDEEEETLHPVQAVLSGLKVASEVKEAIELRHNPAWSAFVDTIYGDCMSAIQLRKGLHLLPKETLRTQVKYDAFGYPRGEPAVLAATGKYASVLGLTIDVRFLKKTQKALLKKSTKVRPQITLHLQLFDEQGRIIWLDTIRTKAEHWSPIRRPRYYYTSPEFFRLLRGLVQEALDELLGRPTL
ncbi:MAG: hypothetical protein D6743_09275 [Calditrichaeota bacterium]|nr:MAG: hypothetical protein D6743_09275 [Calditrichota bacterium]